MRRFLPYLAFAALLVGAAGCNANPDYGTKGGETDPKADEKRIEDNPNMPAPAKAAALAQLRAHQQGSPSTGK
jgi:hypothetical protein